MTYTIDEVKKIIYRVLDEQGVYFELSELDFDLRDSFLESIQFISFIVGLEQELEIEIPDEMLTLDSIASFNGFCQRILQLTQE